MELLAALAGEVAPGSSEHLFWAQQYRWVHVPAPPPHRVYLSSSPPLATPTMRTVQQPVLLAALAGELTSGSSEHLFWAQQYR